MYWLQVQESIEFPFKFVERSGSAVYIRSTRIMFCVVKTLSKCVHSTLLQLLQWTGKKTQFRVTCFLGLTVSYQVRFNMVIGFVFPAVIQLNVEKQRSKE